MTTASTTVLKLTLIPLDKLAPHPDNVRKDLGDLTEISKSIAGSGILEPLLVLPADDTGVHLVVAGHRRLAGSRKAGITEAPCVIRDMTPVEVLEAMLVENLQRADITPVEEARAYARLVELGTKVADIARKVGRSQALVKSRLALTTLPDGILDAVERRVLTLGEAEEIAQYADDEDVTAWIVAKCATHTPSKWEIENYISGRAKTAARKAEEAKLAKAGLQLFNAPQGWWDPYQLGSSLTSPISVAKLHLPGGAAKHTKEMCHRVHLEPERTGSGPGDWKMSRTPICIMPKRHTDKAPDMDRSALQIPAEYLPGAGAKSSQPPTESKAEKAERLARSEAAASRRAFVQQLIAAAPPLDLDPVMRHLFLVTFEEQDVIIETSMYLDLRALTQAEEDEGEEPGWVVFDEDKVAGPEKSDRWLRAWAVVAPEATLAGELYAGTTAPAAARYLRWLVEQGYTPTDWERAFIAEDQARLAETAKVDVEALALSDEAFDAIVEIHEACDADPAMGHPGGGIGDDVLEDLKERGYVDVAFTESGPAITFTDEGARVATAVVAEAEAA